MPGTVVATTITDGNFRTSVTNLITGSAKAWVYFNGSTAVIKSSYNVTSVVRNTTGSWYINIPAGVFSAGDYGAVVTCGRGSPARFAMTSDSTVARTATRLYLACAFYNGGAADVDDFSVALYR